MEKRLKFFLWHILAKSEVLATIVANGIRHIRIG